MPDDTPHGEHEALQRLSAYYGIATEYSDIFGQRHVAPAANLVSLLTSFGVDPTMLPHESLQRAHAATWREHLTPVVAIDAEAPRWLLRVRIMNWYAGSSFCRRRSSRMSRSSCW